MHFEILVEDISGKKALDILIGKIVRQGDTYIVHPYKGIGHIPKGMKDAADPSKRILLTNLPKLLKGYGRTFKGYPASYKACLIVVCDLDSKKMGEFLSELNAILVACDPQPEAKFCLAIEEGEAWLLGDIPAIKAAYPHAKSDILSAYINDSIGHTWETLADAVYPGGSAALLKRGKQFVGIEKSRWASDLSPRMDVENNRSPSFKFFRDTVRSLHATK